MNIKHVFHKERIGAPAIAAGKPMQAHFLVAVLMAALLLTCLCANASAQICLDGCQRTLAECLQLAQGNPIQEAQCQDDYDDCAENCLFL